MQKEIYYGHVLWGKKMIGMFERKRPNRTSTENLKRIVGNHFGLSENDFVSIAELNCLESGCPSKETVISIHSPSGETRSLKVQKSIAEINSTDIENLVLK